MTRLLLVGGGHTHVQVLRHIAMQWRARQRFEDVEVTVVLDQPVAVYSGMVPGFVAKQYERHELEIDVLPLARRAGARVVLAAMTSIDPTAREIHLEGRPPLRYDVASIDIGSTVAGLDLPGVREHALATRPIGDFARRAQLLEQGASRRRVAVVGGGAGGVELAFCVQQPLPDAEVHLVHGGAHVLDGYAPSVVRRVEAAARARGIALDTGCRATEVGPDWLNLNDGRRLEDCHVLWVSGAVAHAGVDLSALATEARGFIRTRADLRAKQHDDLFAVGDCACQDDFPETPKAGVYAVRQGPYLIRNLEALLEGRSLEDYRPQSDFLALLNLGDGTAIGAKWGRSFEGPWVMRLKDRIDRRFMERFQVLDPQAQLSDAFEPMEGMDEMFCGGCAAKVGQSSLERALSRLPAATRSDRVVLGVEEADDAAVWRTRSDDQIVTSVDAFRAFSGDAFLVGQVAAVNATNDVWAKGVAPHSALALVTVPEEAPGEAQEEVLFQCLAGVRDRLDLHGIDLLGGHSTLGPELTVGLAVTGEATAELLSIDRLTPGDAVVVTHSLGTGVLLRADAQGLLPGPWLETVHRSMLRSVADAVEIAGRHGVLSATDVTGFGLAGHLGEMAHRSGVRIVLQAASVPALPGALELLERGMRSTAHPANRESAKAFRIETPSDLRDAARIELTFDPQTCGGLALAVPESRAEALASELRIGGFPDAAIVAKVCSRSESEPSLEIVVQEGRT
ncbi:MAG: selenide, water dikinase SelD [Acidobacteriota bacterium]